MKVGIPGLGLAVAEPMAVDAIAFQQGGKPGLPSPVTIRWAHLSFLWNGGSIKILFGSLNDMFTLHLQFKTLGHPLPIFRI